MIYILLVDPNGSNATHFPFLLSWIINGNIGFNLFYHISHYDCVYGGITISRGISITIIIIIIVSIVCFGLTMEHL